MIQVSTHIAANAPAASGAPAGGGRLDPAQSRDADTTFAGTMHAASPRPGRKASASKASETDPPGDPLPATGNSAPPLASSLPPGVLAANPTPAALSALTGGTAVAAPPGPPAAALSSTGTHADGDQADATAQDMLAAVPQASAPVAGATGAAGKPTAEAVDRLANPLDSSIAPPPPAAPVPGVVDSARSASSRGSPAALNSTAGTTGAAGKAAVKAAPKAATAKAAANAPNAPVSGADGEENAPPPGSAAGMASNVASQTAIAAPATDAAAAASIALAADSKPKYSAGPMQGNSDDGADAAQAGAPADPAGPGVAGTAGAAGFHAVVSAADAQSAAVSMAAAALDKHAHTGDAAAPPAGAGDAAAGLSQLSQNGALGGAPDAAPAPMPTLHVHASVDSAEFAQGLCGQVSWLVGNGMNSAKLQVNPPQLGPIELRISVQGDHAQVWMASHSAVTRDALESSSPKLREMLGAQGFGQVSVDISQRSFQDRSAYTPRYERSSPGGRAIGATSAVSAVASTAPRTASGALDAYA